VRKKRLPSCSMKASAVESGWRQYSRITCDPWMTISPVSLGPSSRRLSGSSTRESTPKVGIPKHCSLVRSGGFACVIATVSVRP